MFGSGGRLASVCRGVYREIRAERVSFKAGSIAYHAFISLVPFLLVVVSVFHHIGQPTFGHTVVTTVASYISPTQAHLLSLAVTNATDDTGITLLGSVTLLWGLFQVFSVLDTVFSDVYHDEAQSGLVGHVVDGLTVLLAVGLAVVVAAAAGAVIPAGSATRYDPLVDYLAVAGGVSLALFPMYYVFPDTDLTVREVLPGTVFAAVGWVVAEAVFTYYTTVAASRAYGIVGSVLLLLIWLYVSGLFLLVGAILNAVLAGRAETAKTIVWQDSTVPTTNWDRLVDELETLDGAIQAETRLVVETESETVTLPPPGDARIRTRHVSRPGPLGGEKHDAVVQLRWKRHGDGEAPAKEGEKSR
ncbi:YihY/virulence factor BrkB family protein [Haloarchaeobius sp. TZWWS8]|uniref:YihY/virulence factor BrkB family protein n=1 Tax=Haloarchaeobius sp. TZWWS8 TaxID=3446121 RepID=UPI003EBDA93D